MKSVSVIMNPSAGNNKLKNDIHIIKQKLSQKYESVDIYLTKEPGDGANYVRKIANNVDLIIGAGGDGTIYELINAICGLEKRPAFAIIPGGTCNDFSRAVGMSQKPLEALEQILDEHQEKVDVGYTDHQYFLNFWGIGLITQVSENLESDKKLGRLSYYISTMQTINNAESFHLKLASKERDYDGKAVMVIVGNGPFTGGLQAFFPNCNLQDGLLDVLILKDTSLPTFWSILRSSVASEDLFNKEEIIHFQTNELTIECEPEQKIDCDGERNESTPAHIKILPQHLTVMVGDFSN
ncbi:diacylglycerol/lipid kinase family protein [Scopulibacillus cellulosilyticus]|uniref:Diacylglycerol/lipid kinase family protein n=1 Tax=Scopulibacillus cellulosilyticus TaxID=2665665 RepID=A0ABW2Q3Y4_9BACL